MEEDGGVIALLASKSGLQGVYCCPSSHKGPPTDPRHALVMPLI
jgi:hypothetical protein